MTDGKSTSRQEKGVPLSSGTPFSIPCDYLIVVLPKTQVGRMVTVGKEASGVAALKRLVTSPRNAEEESTLRRTVGGSKISTLPKAAVALMITS